METTENQGFSPITLIVVVAVIVIGAIWLITGKDTNKNQDTAPMATSSQATTTTATTTPRVIEDVTYTDTAHQFAFTYPNSWKKTDALARGLYSNTTIFVPEEKEADIIAAKKGTSEELKALVQDQALIIKINKSNSINQVISSEYGSNITVESRPMAGRSVARVVHSKTTDPANWQGGSREAYLIRNSLGEVIIIEANYSTEEINTESDLRALMEGIVKSFKIQAI